MKKLKLSKKILMLIIALAVLYGCAWVVSYGIAKHKVDSAKAIPAWECGTPSGNTFVECNYYIGRGFLQLPKASPASTLCCTTNN